MRNFNQIKFVARRSPPQFQQRPCEVNMDSNNVNFVAFCLSSFLSFIVDTICRMCPSWISNWIKWCPTSLKALEATEAEILSYLKRPYETNYVNIGKCWEKQDNFMWTLKMDPPTKNNEDTPLVLIHGFATGIGLWVLNLDHLSSTRTVYAFDMLGFGMSSRPAYTTDPSDVEQQFVTAIEMWRRAIGLNHMILLAHGMGGYLATSYALRHPEVVEHLILVDPWGFPERPIAFPHRYEMPDWIKFISTFLNNFNLLAILRAAGPLGPYFVHKFRKDLQQKFCKCLRDPKAITRYIYHCNAQRPSGEVGFKRMTDSAGWPINPMVNRIAELDPRMPIDFIYGSRSWVHRQPALQIKYSRLDSFVGVQIIEGAGHHVYADQPEQFNSLIIRICDGVEDSNICPQEQKELNIIQTH